MTLAGTPVPAGKWQLGGQIETTFATAIGSYPAAALAGRAEAGSTYSDMYAEIPDTSLSEDFGGEESGKGLPDFNATIRHKCEGLGTAAGDGEEPADTLLSILLASAFSVTSRKPYGSAITGTPSATSVEQEAETTEYVADELMGIDLPNLGFHVRPVASVASKVNTMAMAFPEAPTTSQIIQGGIQIPISTYLSGLNPTTLQLLFKAAHQYRTVIARGCVPTSLQFPAVSRGEQQLIEFVIKGAAFLRNQSVSFAQGSTQRPRCGAEGYAWLADIGSAQTPEQLRLYNWRFNPGINVELLPSQDEEIEYSGVSTMFDPTAARLNIQVLANAVPGYISASRLIEHWESGTDNYHQPLIQMGKAAGRTLTFHGKSMIMYRPERGESANGREILNLSFGWRAGTTGRLGTIALH